MRSGYKKAADEERPMDGLEGSDALARRGGGGFCKEKYLHGQAGIP
jgi:hypothetical protein